MKSLWAVLVAAFIAGCTVNSTVPDGYSGPTAHIADSSTGVSSRKADFFYVDAIDGKKVENALNRTARANYGHGLAMEVQISERVPLVQSTRVHIVEQTHYAAPVLALGGTSYYIEGDATFAPVAGQSRPRLLCGLD